MHPVRYQEIGNRAAAALLKYPVLNHAVLRELRRLRAGRWQKVIKCGNIGEVHISNIVPVVWQESSSIPGQ